MCPLVLHPPIPILKVEAILSSDGPENKEVWLPSILLKTQVLCFVFCFFKLEEPGFQSHFQYLLVVWPWASVFLSAIWRQLIPFHWNRYEINLENANEGARKW